MTTSNKPYLIAYHVLEVSKNSYWDRVGATFGNKDEQGFDLVLDSLPVGGRVVLRIPPKGRKQQTKSASRAINPASQALSMRPPVPETLVENGELSGKG